MLNKRECNSCEHKYVANVTIKKLIRNSECFSGVLVNVCHLDKDLTINVKTKAKSCLFLMSHLLSVFITLVRG